MEVIATLIVCFQLRFARVLQQVLDGMSADELGSLNAGRYGGASLYKLARYRRA